MNPTTLFCLPYAGGSATIYNKWRRYFDHSIVLHPVELAGRGRRFNEALYHSIEEAVEDIYIQIKPFLHKQFAFFGHSMGSLLVHEVSCKIKEEEGRNPVHIFASGRKAPHCPGNDKITHNLSDQAFKKEIHKLGGTPKEVLQNKNVFDFFKPILKADYKMIEEYKYTPRAYKLDCPITVLNGIQDRVKEKELIAWEQVTTGDCTIIHFDGGHFFIHNHFQSIVKLIHEKIAHIGSKT